MNPHTYILKYEKARHTRPLLRYGFIGIKCIKDTVTNLQKIQYNNPPIKITDGKNSRTKKKLLDIHPSAKLKLSQTYDKVHHFHFLIG